MKRKILIAVAAVLTLFLALPVAAVYWLIYTENGLRFAIDELQRLKHVVLIQADGVHGSLARGVRIESVSVEHERVSVRVQHLAFRIRPRALLLQTVQVEDASIGRARVEVRLRVHPPSDAALKFLPSFLRVQARNARLGEAEVILPNQTLLNGHALHSDLVLTSNHLALSNLFADGGFFTAAGSFDMGAAEPITLRSDLDWTLVLAGRAPWKGRLHAEGDLEDLEIKAEQSLPVQARISGRALALTHDWHWEARLTSAFIDFAQLIPAAKIAVADIAIDVSGDHTGMKAAGSLRPTSIPTGKLQVRAHGPYPTRRVQLDAIDIEASGGARVKARAVLNFLDGGPDISLSGSATDFRWPLLGNSVVAAKSLHFSLLGPHLPYRFTVTGPINVPRLPVFALEAAGLLHDDHLELSTAKAGWLKGRIEAAGRLGWTGRKEWSFTAVASDLDPSLIDPLWPGRLGGSAALEGAGLDADADVAVKIGRIDGTLRGEKAFMQGGVQRRKGELIFDRVLARWADAHAELDGSYGNPRDIRLSLEAPHLQRVLPQMQGAISVEGRLSGPAGTARLSGSMTGHSLVFASLIAQDLHASADIDMSDSLASHFDLKAQGVTLAARKLGTVSAALEGRASDHRFNVDTKGGLIDVHARVSGAYDPKGWTGSIDELALRGGEEIDVSLEAPTPVRISPDSAALSPMCLLGAKERVCAQGDWLRGGAWNARAKGSGIPLRALGTNLPTKPEYMGLLAFDADAHGRTLDDMIGSVSVDLAEGTLRYALPSGRTETLHLGSGHGEITATPSRLDASLHLAATQQSFIDLKLKGDRVPGQSVSQTPVSGEIHTQAHELGFIPLLVTQIDRAVGQMNADLAVSGTLAEPRLDGAVKLQQGEVDIYQVNLLMREINGRIDIAGTKIAVAGSAAIGAGKASIDGNLAWTQRKPKGEIRLHGERLMMVNIPELRADASPDLTFKIDGTRIDVDGTVTIPYARIKPADLTGAVLSSSDEVIVGQQSGDDEQHIMIYTDLKLVLGPDVTVDTYGLSGRLTGSVSASSDPSGAAHGSGELKIEEGKYAAYGRQLDIQRGRLIFSGGLVSDPAVDLRAVKVFPDVTAGVNVRGKLRNPQISFFSEPSLPQSQIVSVLVAGGTIESLQKSGAQQVGQARNELLAQGGAIVAQQLGARMGVEDVGLESDTLNQTSLVLGKFLNPRLYVSYGISLTESLNTVKLRYTLGDHWTIKTEAGENRSTDLIFTIER